MKYKINLVNIKQKTQPKYINYFFVMVMFIPMES